MGIRGSFRIGIGTALLALGIAVPAPLAAAASAGSVPVRELVFLKPGANVDLVAAAAARLTGGHVLHTYKYALSGFEIETTSSSGPLLSAMPLVARVMRDVSHTIDLRTAPLFDNQTVPFTGQLMPPDVARVGGAATLAKVRAAGGTVDADIAILDGGVDASQPDLNVAGGVNCTRAIRSTLEGRPAWNDVSGHGTFVAGAVAAKDNGIGVVGVAPGARIWAVKVFSDYLEDVPGTSEKSDLAAALGEQGVTFSGDLLCGWDWVARHASMIDAVNISLGGGAKTTPCNGWSDHLHPTGTKIDEIRMNRISKGTLPEMLLDTTDAEHEAVCRVVAAGVTVVTAAGNSSADVAGSVPAGYPEVVTVSGLADFDGKPGGLAKSQPSCALNFPRARLPEFVAAAPRETDDTRASFSDYGTGVDLIAPAVCNVSTGLNGTYVDGDGTSFASPLVAGAVALYKWHHPSATPAQIAAALKTAGTHDYNDAGDPDHTQEPLLNVTSLL